MSDEGFVERKTRELKEKHPIKWRWWHFEMEVRNQWLIFLEWLRGDPDE